PAKSAWDARCTSMNSVSRPGLTRNRTTLNADMAITPARWSARDWKSVSPHGRNLRADARNRIARDLRRPLRIDRLRKSEKPQVEREIGHVEETVADDEAR